jgi:Response regulator containing CheY-like receiver, AAA-type ATPase, and DNA-binding domains
MSRILIVEDEMNLAMMMEDLLTNAGHRVFKAARLSRGLALAASEPLDFAFLDINLAGEEVFPLALELRSLDVPFVFTSGYGASGIPASFGDCRILQKPYVPQQLFEVLAMLL